MDDFSNSGNQNSTQRPQLKKVKRPINRLMPQTAAGGSSAMPQQPAANTALYQESSDMPQATASAVTDNPFRKEAESAPQTESLSNAFDLDAYLDEDNLPAATNVPDNFYNNDAPQFLDENDLVNDGSHNSKAAELPPYLTKKILIVLGAVLFFMGILMAKLLFTEEKVVRNGLQGVVVNPEVPRGRARCGVAEKTQGCVLYIMNPQRQELNARDFYDLASQLTGRQRFVIETGNMRYSNTKIRPGDIVQLNIPPL